MTLFEIILLGVALSMDAFAASICKGLSIKNIDFKSSALIALYFGGFQALMPLIGYLLGFSSESLISEFDHWIAFTLLCIIGGKMLKDAISQEGISCNANLSFKSMIVLAIATSIDALIVGVSFAFLKVNIFIAISIIGIITFIISLLGVKLGNYFGTKWQRNAQILGGVILILIGIKILIEQLGLI